MQTIQLMVRKVSCSRRLSSLTCKCKSEIRVWKRFF